MLLQRWKAKIGQKESSPRPGIKFTTHESDILTTEPPGWGQKLCYFYLFFDCHSTSPIDQLFQKMNPADPCPTRVAQWWACPTHDLEVVSLISGWGKLFFRRFLCHSSLLKHVSKVTVDGGFGKKVVLVLVWGKPGNTCASPTAMIWP